MVQLVNVPTSPVHGSAIASFQLPFRVVNRSAQLVVADVCWKPVGPKPVLLSAVKVPVRGAAKPLIVLPPNELNVVFTNPSEELLPVPLSSSPTKFITTLLGPIRFIDRSPT